MAGKLLVLLSRRERRRGALVMAMFVVMAALDTVGVASVMPFLSVLGNPSMVRSNPLLSSAYDLGGFASIDAFLLALGIGAFVLILVSAIFRTVTLYALDRFVEMRRYSVGERLLETYLRQPYAFFLDRHSGDMAKSILSEVDQLVQNVFRPGIEVIAYSTVFLAIVVLLVVVNPLLAGVAAGMLGALYGGVYFAVRGILGRLGGERVRANKERFTAAGEALAGIKEVKLLGREEVYLDRFRGPSRAYARHQATNQTLSQAPNFVVEAVAFGGIIALTLGLLAAYGGVRSDALGEILPVLGVYALAGLRMKPAAQHIYRGITRLRFGAAAVDEIYRDLRERRQLGKIPELSVEPLRPCRSIALSGVSYTYPQSDVPALAGIDLEIPVGSSVGLVGSTGAGKTTLVDVLLGLLSPTRGAIQVDETAITEANLRAWQTALGYVPQEIFLADASVAENIALGVPAEQVDYERVAQCARMAQVESFILGELPDQYDTLVGERGVRLSGGQRQRIGIARALYTDPAVLVLDEATSALDNRTEQAVMEAVYTASQDRTLIVIAHRLSTVRQCRKVVLLEEGRIAASGSFEELRQSSSRFRAMAAGES